MRTPSAEHLCRFSSGTNIFLSAAGEERVPATSVLMTELETPALSSRGGVAGQYEPFGKLSGGANSATSSSTDEAAQAIKVETPLNNNPAVTGILRIMFPLNDFIEECLQLIPFEQQSVYSLSTWVSQLVRTRGWCSRSENYRSIYCWLILEFCRILFRIPTLWIAWLPFLPLRTFRCLRRIRVHPSDTKCVVLKLAVSCGPTP